MLISIDENYYDYETEHYFIDSEKLKPEENVLDKMLLEVLNKKSFKQELHVDVNKMRELYPDDPLFEEGEQPCFTNDACKRRKPKDKNVDKHVTVDIVFDC